jgi:hypothetical protein
MKNSLTIKSIKSPRSIKDFRLWLGLIFVILSIALAQLVISKATARTQALVVTKAVPAGSSIAASDLQLAEVVLPTNVTTVELTSEAVGMIAARDLFPGDVLIKAAITNQTPSNLRLVSVPIKAGHLPNLTSGQLVDIWVTPSTDGMALPGPAQLVINQATINAVPTGIDPTLDTAVTLLISGSDVQVLVQAMRDGVIDLVALPDNRRSSS